MHTFLGELLVETIARNRRDIETIDCRRTNWRRSRTILEGRKDTGYRQLEQRWVDSITRRQAVRISTPLQGGSGWSISDALYVTNLRTRRSLMPVRGPWCGRVYAWVIKYDEKRRERDAPWISSGFLNVRHAADAIIARSCDRDYMSL